MNQSRSRGVKGIDALNERAYVTIPKSKKKVREDMRKLEAKMPVVGNPKAFNAGFVNGLKLKRAQLKTRLINDADGRDIWEVWHTLIEDDTKPIKHAMLSRREARNRNYNFGVWDMKFKWVLGKQKLEKS